MSKGQLSITTIILGSYPIYTIILSRFINGENLTTTQAVFIAITIFGTLGTSLPTKISAAEIKKVSLIFWPVVAAIGVGLSDALSKNIINKTADFTFLFALALVQIPVALTYLRLEKVNIAPVLRDILRKSDDYKHTIFGSLFNIIGTGLLWVAFTFTMASIASPITATGCVFAVILAMLFMDEKVTRVQLFSIILVLIGVLGISAL